MKFYKTTFLAVMSIIIITGLSSCNKGDSGTNSNWSMFDAPEWYAPEPDNSQADLVEATLEQPFDIVEADNDYRLCDGTRKNDKTLKERRKFLPLARVLKSLNLDDIQKAQMKDFLFDFRLCVKESVMKLRESERELLIPFNQQRKLIYEDYKSGKITREEATTQLKQLAVEVREVLKENGLRVQACEEMKECMKQLFRQIETILDEKQLKTWNEWLAKLPVVDCSKRQ